MTDGNRLLASWVDGFVSAESQPDRIDEWIDRIAAPILAENPEFVEDAVLSHTVRAAVRSHWVSFLTNLSEPPHDVRLVQPAADLATQLAQRGHQLTVLFRVYRVAQQAVWGYIISVVDETDDADLNKAEVLVFLWTRVSAWLDSSVESSVELFQGERDRLLQGAAAQRLDVVRETLAGKVLDARRLSASLGGHPVSEFNTCVLLHTENNASVADLDAAAARLARQIGPGVPVVVSPGGRDLWCWLATRSMPDLSGLHECSPWLAEQEIMVAVGTPAEGIEGFRLSYREAQDAQMIALQASVTRPLTLFSEVELLSLLSGSPDAARRFTVRTLGELADQSDAAARLRDTLRALLSSGSVEDASQILSVHKNTVRYRVSQAEQIIGHSVSKASTELELALRYFDMFMTRPRPAPERP